MFSRSWALHGDGSGVGRPSFTAEPVRRVGEDALVLSAAGLLQAALRLSLTPPGITTEGK